MQGIPKILQTRADFDLALDMARSDEASLRTVASHFVGLIESAHRYVYDRDMSDGEAPDGVMPDYCVTEATEADPVRRQLKREVDPSARLFELGYTIGDVRAIITDLEG